MMLRLCIPLLCGVAVAQSSLFEAREPVTLDSAEMARIWQEVKGGKAEAAAQASPSDTWQKAMLAEDAEQFRVLLLAWLQQQNPALGLDGAAASYARAVSLHLMALQGNTAACAACAGAYRSGRLGELTLPVSEQKARWFEQRALVAGNLPE